MGTLAHQDLEKGGRVISDSAFSDSRELIYLFSELRFESEETNYATRIYFASI